MGTRKLKKNEQQTEQHLPRKRKERGAQRGAAQRRLLKVGVLNDEIGARAVRIMGQGSSARHWQARQQACGGAASTEESACVGKKPACAPLSRAAHTPCTRAFRSTRPQNGSGAGWAFTALKSATDKLPQVHASPPSGPPAPGGSLPPLAHPPQLPVGGALVAGAAVPARRVRLRVGLHVHLPAAVVGGGDDLRERQGAAF